jgi:hypothetical protein
MADKYMKRQKDSSRPSSVIYAVGDQGVMDLLGAFG